MVQHEERSREKEGREHRRRRHKHREKGKERHDGSDSDGQHVYSKEVRQAAHASRRALRDKTTESQRNKTALKGSGVSKSKAPEKSAPVKSTRVSTGKTSKAPKKVEVKAEQTKSKPEASAPVDGKTKVARKSSVRDPKRTSLTRPIPQRSATVAARTSQVPTATGATRKRPESMPAKPTTVESAPESTPNKANRKSTGLLGVFFGAAPARPPPAPVKNIECVICLGDDIPATKAAKLGCGHRMCHACLKRQFELSVTDPQHMPPRCCTEEHIPLKHVDRLFSDKFKIQWNKKYQEYKTKNRIYCPAKGCGEWIKPSHMHVDAVTGRKYGKCNRCKTKVCVRCNGKWHVKKECPKDEETKRFAEIARERGWQQCYNCKAMVELKEGCNHMTCRCTAQFCMMCAARWKTCSCPWFNYTNEEEEERPQVNIAEPMRILAQIRRDPWGMLWNNPGARPASPPHEPAPPAAPADNPQPPEPRQRPAAQRAAAPRGSARPANRRTTTTARRRAREQEEQDAALAQALQEQLNINDDTGADAGAAAEEARVFGFGNGGGHHMNERYAVRPPAPGPQQQQQQPSRNRNGAAPAAGRAAETPLRRAMTDLLRERSGRGEGPRRGAEGLASWFQHGARDPAEAEGRASRRRR